MKSFSFFSALTPDIRSFRISFFRLKFFAFVSIMAFFSGKLILTGWWVLLDDKKTGEIVFWDRIDATILPGKRIYNPNSESNVNRIEMSCTKGFKEPKKY